MSIVINRYGLKVSSESVDLDPQNPMFECPKCGCVYGSIIDISSLFDKNNKLLPQEQGKYVCNECGTELDIYKGKDQR
jgi:predicted RNA-binding Zn-ribbon protein involved in translation (DUF1610 family)